MPILTAASVHVWWALLTDTREIAAAEACLSPDEVARSQRLVMDRDRQRFIYHRATLRQILSAYTACTPADLQFSTAAYGKPYLAYPPDAATHFNVSHAGDYALYAIARQPIGVDVEEERSVPVAALTQRFFSARECTWLQAQPGDRQAAAFFQLWTAKEAYLKATGRGLAALQTVDVIWADPPQLVINSAPAPPDLVWHLSPLAVRSGYYAALVTPFRLPHIAVWAWDESGAER